MQKERLQRWAEASLLLLLLLSGRLAVFIEIQKKDNTLMLDVF
jgi:hypothetical protein